MHGGSSRAYAEAMKDPGEVVGVSWYTLKLPGMAGSIGLKHSLLEVRVRDSRDSVKKETRHYVIEKAYRPRERSSGREDQYMHGLHISKFKEVANSVERPAFRNLPEERVQKGLTMQMLREKGLEGGFYHVALSNCHHLALHLYNYCAVKRFQLQNMPNEWAIGAAKLLTFLGVNVAGSGSGASRSCESGPVELGVTSESSRSDSVISGDSPASTTFPILDNSSLASNRWVASAALLAYWIYHPAREGFLVFTNEYEEEVVVYAEEADHEIRLQTGQTGSFRVSAPEVHVRLNRVGLLGLTSPRTRLARVRLSPGKSYIIRAAHESNTATCDLQDAVLPEVATIEVLQLSEKGPFIQYGIVVTGSAIYIVFRGTAGIMDVLIDVGFVPFDGANHGLGVHSSMWSAITHRKHGILDAVHSKVQQLLAKYGKLPVVVCGHSLGGSGRA